MVLFVSPNAFWQVGKLYGFGKKTFGNSWRCFKNNYLYFLWITVGETDTKHSNKAHWIYSMKDSTCYKDSASIDLIQKLAIYLSFLLNLHVITQPRRSSVSNIMQHLSGKTLLTYCMHMHIPKDWIGTTYV